MIVYSIFLFYYIFHRQSLRGSRKVMTYSRQVAYSCMIFILHMHKDPSEHFGWILFGNYLGYIQLFLASNFWYRIAIDPASMETYTLITSSGCFSIKELDPSEDAN